MPPTCYAGYRPLRFPRSWDRGADQTRQALGVRRTDTCRTRPRMVSTHGTASHAAVRAEPDPVRPSPAEKYDQALPDIVFIRPANRVQGST
jgi:hypothetical protein